jgi:hypothetical protein
MSQVFRPSLCIFWTGRSDVKKYLRQAVDTLEAFVAMASSLEACRFPLGQPALAHVVAALDTLGVAGAEHDEGA